MTSPTMAPIPVAHPRPAMDHPNGVQLGGIGTGRIELGRNGRLTLAGITNNWQRLLAGLEGAFFSLHLSSSATPSTFHLLQAGSLEGHPAAEVTYRGLHPVSEVGYLLPDSPVTVSLTCFSPLIPHDFPSSNIPGSVFLFRLSNPSPRPCTARLAFSWENLLGVGGAGRRGTALHSNRTGNHQEPWRQGGACGIRFLGPAEGRPPNACGDMVLAVKPPAGTRPWAFLHWNIPDDRAAVLAALAQGEEAPAIFDGGDMPALEKMSQWKKTHPPSWDDPDPRFGGGRTGLEGTVHPAAILGTTLELAPGSSIEIPFVLAWHTPAHTTLDQPGTDHSHSYTERFPDAGSVASLLLEEHPRLFERTCDLHAWLRGSSLPGWLAEKCCNDLTALTTNSIVTRAGELFTLEASPMMFGSLGTLDQRLVSHPGYSLFYPDLNRTELRTFARLQAPDGSLPHFNGNAHTALGSADVEYGRTGWPDLACSFIVQCYRDWTETGEDAFFHEMLPFVRRAADWLMEADCDGDGIPEGGSSWDIEHYEGCFIATATVWLATLRVLEAVFDRTGDPDRAEKVRHRFAKSAETVDAMWTGTTHLKYLDPVSGAFSDDVFLGQLAGEWIVRQLGLAPVIPEDRACCVLETLYRLHGDRSRYPLMPIQVRPDGTLPDRKYGWHAWPQYSLVFVDCLAFYLGLHDRAMQSLHDFHKVVHDINQTPWATTLWHDARTGRPDFGSFTGLDWYMNTPSTWWVLPALTGFSADEPAAAITLGPCLREGNWPVVTPRYRARLTLDCPDGRRTLGFTPDYFHRGTSLTLRRIRWRGTETRAVIAGRPCEGSVSDGTVVFTLEPAVTLTAGQTLTVVFTV